jgi:alpha-ketoglutarate-dependent taurine dioxygenase
MRITHVRTDEDSLTVIWHDGGEDAYHYVWLRDNLLAGHNLDLATGERMLNFDELPERPLPVSASVEAGDLVIVWEDTGQSCRYPADWLHSNSYARSARNLRSEFFPPTKTWSFDNWSNGPSFDFRAIEQSAAAELECLRAFKTYGVVYLRNTPIEQGIAESLCIRLGYVREVAFGRVREIRSDPVNHQNVAFSSDEVNPHADAANYLWPYQVQFLHCIANDARGGDSRIVDARTLAEQFRSDEPVHFSTLARVPVSYRIGSGGHDLRVDAPVIELDNDGKIRMIRFSNQQRRTLSVPHEDVVPFFDAYRAFSKLVNDRENQFHFRFAPGDALMFDNHRILHGRTSFEPATGLRHLQLASTDLDMVDSRIRVLTKEVRGEADTEALLPDELSGLRAAQ